MKKFAKVMAISLMGVLMVVTLAGCPTKIEREGMTVMTWDRDVARTAIEPIRVEVRNGNTVETSGELATWQIGGIGVHDLISTRGCWVGQLS